MLTKTLSLFGLLSIVGGVIGAFLLWPTAPSFSVEGGYALYSRQVANYGPMSFIPSVAILVAGVFWGILMRVGAKAAEDLTALRGHHGPADETIVSPPASDDGVIKLF